MPFAACRSDAWFLRSDWGPNRPPPAQNRTYQSPRGIGLNDLHLAHRAELLELKFKARDYFSAIAKVVEKVVQCQLQHYLTRNHLLSPTQYGFRPYYSTASALIQITDRVLASIDH